MNFELPAPGMHFEVALDDGAKIRVRDTARRMASDFSSPTATALRLTHIFPSGSTFCLDMISWSSISAIMVRTSRLRRRITITSSLHATSNVSFGRSRLAWAVNRPPAFFIPCRREPR